MIDVILRNGWELSYQDFQQHWDFQQHQDSLHKDF